MSNPFRYFNSSPEVIRLVVMMYVRYPLSLRNVEDLLAEHGITGRVTLRVGEGCYSNAAAERRARLWLYRPEVRQPRFIAAGP
jgi:transposase-like protein